MALAQAAIDERWRYDEQPATIASLPNEQHSTCRVVLDSLQRVVGALG